MYKVKYSCYQESSVIHGWFGLLGFCLRNASLVEVIGNPITDGIVFKNELTLLHLA